VLFIAQVVKLQRCGCTTKLKLGRVRVIHFRPLLVIGIAFGVTNFRGYD